MKFDIARKVVKFQNGQYGIRRWSLLGYEFLALDIPSSGDKFFWWVLYPECVATYCAGTEEQVRARLAQYLAPEAMPPTPGFDKGRPA